MAEKETGVVKWFDSKKGYGFIERDFGGDIFVHYTSLSGEGFRKLEEGQRVEYVAEEKGKGPQAFEVVILETPGEDETEPEESEETDEMDSDEDDEDIDE